MPGTVIDYVKGVYLETKLEAPQENGDALIEQDAVFPNLFNMFSLRDEMSFLDALLNFTTRTIETNDYTHPGPTPSSENTTIFEIYKSFFDPIVIQQRVKGQNFYGVLILEKKDFYYNNEDNLKYFLTKKNAESIYRINTSFWQNAIRVLHTVFLNRSDQIETINTLLTNNISENIDYSSNYVRDSLSKTNQNISETNNSSTIDNDEFKLTLKTIENNSKQLNLQISFFPVNWARNHKRFYVKSLITDDITLDSNYSYVIENNSGLVLNMSEFQNKIRQNDEIQETRSLYGIKQILSTRRSVRHNNQSYDINEPFLIFSSSHESEDNAFLKKLVKDYIVKSQRTDFNRFDKYPDFFSIGTGEIIPLYNSTKHVVSSETIQQTLGSYKKTNQTYHLFSMSSSTTNSSTDNRIQPRELPYIYLESEPGNINTPKIENTFTNAFSSSVAYSPNSTNNTIVAFQTYLSNIVYHLANTQTSLLEDRIRDSLTTSIFNDIKCVVKIPPFSNNNTIRYVKVSFVYSNKTWNVYGPIPAIN